MTTNTEMLKTFKHLILLLCGTGIALLCAGCGLIWVDVAAEPSHRGSNAELGGLLMDASLVPDNWKQLHAPAPLPQELKFGDEENLWIAFKREGREGTVRQEVYRYMDAGRARFYFGLELSFPPAGWTYQSPIADNFLIRCKDLYNPSPRDPSVSKFTLCTIRARYGEFISILEAPVQPGMLGVQDMEGIQRGIDVLMQKHLK